MLFNWHKDQKDFHLKELVSKEAMEQILSWMYSHKLTLNEDNLPDVLRTAHYLDCFEVVDQWNWRKDSKALQPTTTTKFEKQKSSLS